MVSYVAKLQQCGKENCPCNQGMLHGPYFWRVSYQGKQKGRKKYKWRYIGSSPNLARDALIYLDDLSPQEADQFLLKFKMKAKSLKKRFFNEKKPRKGHRMQIELPK